MTKLQIGSELLYDVRASTVFLFQITAATTEHQRLLSEQLTFDPGLNVENCQVGCRPVKSPALQLLFLELKKNALPIPGEIDGVV